MILGMTFPTTCASKSFSGLLVCLPKSGTASKTSLWGSQHDAVRKGRSNYLNAIVQWKLNGVMRVFASKILHEFYCFVYRGKLFVIVGIPEYVKLVPCKGSSKVWSFFYKLEVPIHRIVKTSRSIFAPEVCMLLFDLMFSFCCQQLLLVQNFLLCCRGSLY